MSTIRNGLTFGFIALVSVIAFDAVVYLALPDLGRKLSPRFANAQLCSFPGHHLPRYHAVAHAERGFDIAAGIRTIACNAPIEAPPHEVWGNSLGCFDRKIGDDYIPDIYLAGDSMAWGYAPFEKKFGTLLERNTGRKVLKCAVMHTGQRHQFSKFLQIVQTLGRYPDVVIVDYVGNDIANDFAYPHSTVIDGYLVENKYLERQDTGGLRPVELGPDELQRRYREWRGSSEEKIVSHLSRYLERYSATWHLADEIHDRLRDTFDWKSAPGKEIRLYDLLNFILQTERQDYYPIYSPYAEANRNALTRWQQHSRAHGYRLIVSLQPDKKHLGREWFKDLEAFLEDQGIEHYNFERYLVEKGIDPREAFWSHDNHLGFKGNALYAEYLEAVLQR